MRPKLDKYRMTHLHGANNILAPVILGTMLVYGIAALFFNRGLDKLPGIVKNILTAIGISI